MRCACTTGTSTSSSSSSSRHERYYPTHKPKTPELYPIAVEPNFLYFFLFRSLQDSHCHTYNKPCSFVVVSLFISMTMMATQEPTDPSVLLNSHSNNSNSMNTDSTTNTATTSSTTTNGTISHTLLKESTTDNKNHHHHASSELPSTSPSPTGNIRSNQTSATSYTTANYSATPNGTGTGSMNGNHHANATTPSTSATTSSKSTAMLMSATRTPPRSSLANDPNLTPIASIKRPRANLLKSHSSSSTVATPQQQQLQPMLLSPTTTTTPQMTPKPSSTRYGAGHHTAVDDSTPLSPMHKIKPVLHRDTVPVTKSNSTLTSSNANAATNATSVDSPSHPEGLMIKDKVDELFSPVVQFLHDHEHQHRTESDNQPTVPRVTKSTSDDLSIELDFGGGTSSQHYNSDNDDDEEVYADAEDGVVVVQDNEVVDDDDDVSMSRPEQHDYTNEGEFNPWQFIASLPPYESVVVHRPPVTLPPLVEYGMKATGRSSWSSPPSSLLRKTLVLDLDETLVHCSVTEPADHIVDFTFPVQFHGETYSVHVKCRPYLQQFLNEVCQHFEVIVFTASQKVYADALLNILDPSTSNQK
jgi:TFIIF-interacting CTD phosphatase-like protein